MAEERSEHRGGYDSGLHDTGDNDRRQRGELRSRGEQHGGDGDERGGDADGKCRSGGTDDHDPAGEPDGDGGADGQLYGSGGGDGAAELSVAEERSEHRGGYVSGLHDASDDDG